MSRDFPGDRAGPALDDRPINDGGRARFAGAELHHRLQALAGRRPRDVLGVLEYWLAAPSGESAFDVKN
jgi:hypothetical protein